MSHNSLGCKVLQWIGTVHLLCQVFPIHLLIYYCGSLQEVLCTGSSSEGSALTLLTFMAIHGYNTPAIV